MRKSLFIAIVCAILQTQTLAIANADPIQMNGVSISTADMTTMLDAFHHALQDNDTTVLITVTFKELSDMPVYSRDWYYAGTDQKDGKPNVQVWLAKGLDQKRMPHAVLASFMLGMADAGYGGTNWKKVYAAAAAADNALGAAATDPYVNRRKLAETMADLAESESHSKH